MAKKKKEEKIRVVVAPTNKDARIEAIPNTLSAMQEIVGGNIEVLQLDRKTVLICNEEGKIEGFEENAKLYDENGTFLDSIRGDFFICKVNGEEFTGFSETEATQVFEYLSYKPRSVVSH